MKSCWLTPEGARWLGKPTAAGRYELSENLHNIFDGSDEDGVSTLDLYLRGYSWKDINKLVRAGLVTEKFSESEYSTQKGGD